MEYSSFKKAFNKTSIHEGSYSKDPDDPGGETICGISRRYHPHWRGWFDVDANKNKREVVSILDLLMPEIENFYLENFWNRFQGELVAGISEDVAVELFDTAVNCGVTKGAKILQEALNYCNRDETLYRDMAVDGLIGPTTLYALEILAGLRDLDILLKIMNCLQGSHYLSTMKKHRSQEKYARGWFKRVSI